MFHRTSGRNDHKRTVFSLDKEITDVEFFISPLAQWQQHCEEIPEVPEEASSANITPRRLEEENEEIAKLNEEQRNGSPLFGPRKTSKERYLEEKEAPLIEDQDEDLISKFNIDRELQIPKDADVDLSILSPLDSSDEDDDEEYLMSPNDISCANISFSSGNFQNSVTKQPVSKAPYIPKLNLSKIKSPHGNSKINFSLNLSAISGNQSVNDTTCPSSNNVTYMQPSKNEKLQQRGGHKRCESTKNPMNSKFVNRRDEKAEKGLVDSFINEANMITEIFGTQKHHNRRISNLDLTFERSDSKEDDSESWAKEKQSSQKKSKNAFTGSHWNFGSKRTKQPKHQRSTFKI